MSITVVSDETEETRYYVRRIELDNAAPILIERRYSHGGKDFLPDYAKARWNHGDPIQRIEVSGLVLKKDRTTGQQRTEVSYITPASRMWPVANTGKAPDWLLELFGIEVPE